MSRLYDILAQIIKADRKTLLWTNTEPNVDFAAKEVLMNLSGYDAVDVEDTQGRFYRIPKDGTAPRLSFSSLSGSGYTQVNERSATISDTKIVFGDAYFNYGGNATKTKLNSSIKPLHIWGVKLGGVLKALSSMLSTFTDWRWWHEQVVQHSERTCWKIRCSAIRFNGGNHTRWNHRDKRIDTNLRYFQKRLYSGSNITCESESSNGVQRCSYARSINKHGVPKLLSYSNSAENGACWRDTIRGSLCEIVAHPERGCCA